MRGLALQHSIVAAHSQSSIVARGAGLGGLESGECPGETWTGEDVALGPERVDLEVVAKVPKVFAAKG